MQLSGTYQVFELNGHRRLYADIVLPYKEFKQCIMPVVYNAQSGKGEQRNIFPAHARSISEDMLSGLYTPTQFHAGLNLDHYVHLHLNEQTRQFTLDVDPQNPLTETDGHHRDESIYLIKKMADKALAAIAKAPNEEEKAKWERILREIDILPISVNLALDGTPAVDFVNLQKGRPVDQAHILSLSIQQKLLNDPDYKLAFDCARELAQDRDSPFFNLIRFDSPTHQKGQSRVIKQIPVNTLIAQSPSDRSTSLVGLAKTGVGLSTMVECVLKVYSAILTEAEHLFGDATTKLLTPPLYGGTKGSSTMLIGLAIMLAHRCRSRKYVKVNETLVADLVEAAKVTLDKEIAGSFTSSMKRTYLREFAELYFSDDDIPKHHGIPISLLSIIPASAYATPPLKKSKKKDVEAIEAEVMEEQVA